jgi:hypothetical protein
MIDPHPQPLLPGRRRGADQSPSPALGEGLKPYGIKEKGEGKFWVGKYMNTLIKGKPQAEES